MVEDSAAHIMLNALTVTHVSLHSVVAPAGGANEISGGDYARLARTLQPAAARKRLLNADAVFNMDAGHAPKAIGFWNNTAFVGYQELPVKPTFAVNDATYTCPAISTGIAM